VLFRSAKIEKQNVMSGLKKSGVDSSPPGASSSFNYHRELLKGAYRSRSP